MRFKSIFFSTVYFPQRGLRAQVRTYFNWHFAGRCLLSSALTAAERELVSKTFLYIQRKHEYRLYLSLHRTLMTRGCVGRPRIVIEAIHDFLSRREKESVRCRASKMRVCPKPTSLWTRCFSPRPTYYVDLSRLLCRRAHLPRSRSTAARISIDFRIRSPKIFREPLRDRRGGSEHPVDSPKFAHRGIARKLKL